MFIGAKNNVELIHPAVCIMTFRSIFAVSHRLTYTYILRYFSLCMQLLQPSTIKVLEIQNNTNSCNKLRS